MSKAEAWPTTRVGAWQPAARRRRPTAAASIFIETTKKIRLLCTIDDKFCGFADAKDGSRFVLSKKGGIWSDGDGTIRREWTWGEGSKPPLVSLKLSNELTLEFADRETCAVRLRFANCSRDFDVSSQGETEGSYLDTATRGLKGALDPQIDRVSLSQRVAEVGLKSQALKNTLHPKSSVLTNTGTRPRIVAPLEAGFDTYDETHNPGAVFKGREAFQNSVAMTRSEVPRIALTGRDRSVGLGDTIYSSSKCEPSSTLSLYGLELAHELERMNPKLKRSQMIRGASGRYDEVIPVYGGVPTARNPSGKFESGRMALPRIEPADLESYVNSKGDQLVCVVHAL